MKISINWYLKSLRRYVDFNGRASREGFWWFWAINLLMFIVFQMLPSPLGLLYFIGVLLPSAAVTVRRLHDTNRSGLWALPMITIIGSVIPFYFALQEGQDVANQYGVNTKMFFW